jgi:hypothetical protein
MRSKTGPPPPRNFYSSLRFGGRLRSEGIINENPDEMGAS